MRLTRRRHGHASAHGQHSNTPTVSAVDRGAVGSRGGIDAAYGDVQRFHAKFRCVRRRSPWPLGERTRNLRKKLIQEEVRELLEALDSGDVPHIAQEAMDVIFVVLGTLVSMGIRPGRVWDAVVRANMRKIRNPRGGKVMKPKGFRGPEKEIKSEILRQFYDLP